MQVNSWISGLIQRISNMRSSHRGPELPEPEPMDASPVLNNQRLAAYDWGAGEIILSPSAAFKKGFFIKNVPALDQGIILPTSRKDLLSLLAFVHEYRHYQQDVLTGMGNWDYVSRLEAMVETFSLAKNMSDDGRISRPLEEYLAEYQEPLGKYIFHRSESGEVEKIGRLIGPEINGPPEELSPMLSTRRLLEMDAVLYTYDIFRKAKAQKAAWKKLESIGHYYSIVKMPEIYTETIMFSMRSFRKLVIEDIPADQRISNYVTAIKYLLAISLAHPDPISLDRLGHDAIEYIPGVRFARMLKACIEQMKVSGVEKLSPSEYEDQMLSRCSFPYSSYRECAPGWVSYFKSTANNIYPAISDARCGAISTRYRADDQSEENIDRNYLLAASGEPLSDLFSYDLPLLLKRTDGISHPMFLLNKSITGDYHMDRHRSVIGWRLTEFLLRRRKNFLCPLNQSSFCEAKTARCLQPYEDLLEVPADKGCRVRQICLNTDRQHLRF